MISDPLASCCDLAGLEETVGGRGIYIPNVFTPNLDGINDLFTVHTYLDGPNDPDNVGVKQIVSLIVKSSDDQILFQGYNFLPNNPVFGWNGTNMDGQIVEGVFNYEVELEDFSGNLYNFTGSVCSRTGFPLPCIDNETGCMYSIQHSGVGDFDPFLPTQEECE